MQAHYVYEIRRTSEGPGPTRYVGVRTAPQGDPHTDVYMSSSKAIQAAIAAGHSFEKRIVKTFATRAEAELYEQELQLQHLAALSPDFYNQVTALHRDDEWKHGRLRYRSPNGEYLWFPKGSQPDGWLEEQPRIATYHDGQGLFRYNAYEGFQSEGSILDEPSPDNELYALVEPGWKIARSAYFPEGRQPEGWVEFNRHQRDRRRHLTATLPSLLGRCKGAGSLNEQLEASRSLRANELRGFDYGELNAAIKDVNWQGQDQAFARAFILGHENELNGLEVPTTSAAPTQNDKEPSNGGETAKLAGSDGAFWIGLILAAILFAIMLSRPE